MEIPMTTSFNIDDKICPTTGKPFGSKYAGKFSLRRPSLLDKKNIAVKDAASLSFAGDIAAGTISDGVQMTSYVFAFVTTVATEPLPKWFDLATMYEQEDEDAVQAVWQEVVKFLDSFRRQAAGSGSAEGSK